MNCPNCGAPMALLETRPCWQCGHCGSLVCPDNAAGDGVRIVPVGDAARARTCPVCARTLLGAVLDDRYRIETCAHCKGTLLPRLTFAETVIGRRRAATTASKIPRPTSARELERPLRCPSCRAAMLTDWYYGPGNIVIDTCPSCDLVWLDAGELQRVIDAPGADRAL